MEKTVHSGLALALVGILSVCGQPAADNTISLTPVKETTADQSGRLIEYNFSASRSEGRGRIVWRYIRDGTAWQKDEDATFGFRSVALGSGKGTIKSSVTAMRRMRTIRLEWIRHSLADMHRLWIRPRETVCRWRDLRQLLLHGRNLFNGLAVDTEIPLLVRVFRTDGTIIPVSIDAFSEPENSKAVQKSVYAEAYTVIFCYEM